MSQSARVESLDALKEFKADLVTFGVDAQEALAAAETGIRRLLDEIEQQQKLWQAEIRKRQEELTRAKAEMSRQRWGHRDGKGPGMTEAEINLKKAERRLREAEAKLETTRKWLLHLPREVAEYQGVARRMGSFVETDLKRGVALLERRIEAVEAYLTPAAPPPPDGSPS
jgi:multidrug resistance efflux pump